jgi:lipopolysaccharide biosynthesis glycosyltransferase
MKHYPVVFFTNREKDLPYLAVAVRSLAANCSEPEKLQVHVLWLDLSSTALERLAQSWADLPLRYTFHEIEEPAREMVQADSRFGYWAYLWFDRFVSPDCRRVLLLDSDVLAFGDITDLWQLDMEGKAVGAVLDPFGRSAGYGESLSKAAPNLGYEFGPDDPYFNTGVLLVDMNRWRERDVTEEVSRKFEGGFAELTFHDQDTLNLMFRGDIVSLSPKWNMIEQTELYKGWPFDLYRETEPPLEYFETKIRHFAGLIKPDIPWIRRSERQAYYRHLDATEWRGLRSPAQQTLQGRILADVLELHYLISRGLQQRVLRHTWRRIASHLRVAPHSLFIYPGIPFYRVWLKLRRRFD